jgi:hypothetical protein
MKTYRVGRFVVSNFDALQHGETRFDQHWVAKEQHQDDGQYCVIFVVLSLNTALASARVTKKKPTEQAGNHNHRHYERKEDLLW